MTQITDQPQPYPPHYPYPYPYAPVQRRANGLAIASMVLGITWLWWIGSILAIVFGIVAHRQIRDSNGTQSGGGIATAGIVLGWIGIVTFVGFMAIMIAASASTSTGY